jgi:hypothetical protein
MTDNAFVSPLLITNQGSLPWIDFGKPGPLPAIDALADRLNAEIMALTAGLPDPLCNEAAAVLNGYAAGRRFIDLFYRPVWSFLHWMPPPSDAGLLEQACRVQAMSLFLHLWDDHLSDGQLAPDLLRLHLRSLAWQRFRDGAEILRTHAHLPAQAFDSLVAGYLSAVHRPGLVDTLGAHAERMVAQVGIWRVVPLLYGHVAAGPAGGAGLTRIVERFSVAWRLMDDVQDVASDICGTQQNAVALALDPAGQAAWAACAARSAGKPQPDQVTWPAVHDAIGRGALTRVLSHIAEVLDDAQETATTLNLGGLADELSASKASADAER